MATWYRTGTVALTNGSPAVTGTGTAFVANVKIGDAFNAPDGRVYEIAGVISDTQLTLQSNYLGSTASNLNYAIQPTRAVTVQLVTDVQSLISAYADVKNKAGAGKFQSGTAALPGIAFEVDQDLGFYRAAANKLGIAASAGVELNAPFTGTAVTQSATDTTDGRLLKVGDFGVGTAAPPEVANLDNTDLGAGVYLVHGSNTSGTFPGGVKFYGMLEVIPHNNSRILQRLTATGTDKQYWRYHGSSGWDAWRAVVILDANGRLPIGRASASYSVDAVSRWVFSGSSIDGIRFSTPGGEWSAMYAAESNAGGVPGLSLYAPKDNVGAMSIAQRIEKSAMLFYTDEVERMRLSSDGALRHGQSTTSSPGASNTTAGHALEANGTAYHSRVGAACCSMNRISSDGSVLDVRRDGTYKGGISVTTSSVSFNTTSDYRLKTGLAPMMDAASRVLTLNPLRFEFISEPGKLVDGFLAHEAQEVVPEAVHGQMDEVDADGNPVYQGIDQSKLVPLLTGALQEALRKITALEARISALEGNPS